MTSTQAQQRCRAALAVTYTHNINATNFANWETYVSAYTAAGTLIANTRVATGNQGWSDISPLGNGYVVVYQSFVSNDAEVFAQLVDSNGALIGSAIHLDTTTTLSQGDVDVAGLTNGNFVAV